jgi:RHS repeat-associated protein
VTNYLVDTSGSLSHVVAETDGAGNLLAEYVRGDELLAVIRPAAETRFVHTDGVGSVRRLTGEDGLIRDGYTFTAFGELLAHTGTDPQPYAFAGEPLDLNTGWQYHRARWMDPGVGRFTAIDPFLGLLTRPASQHGYFYAEASPTNFSDPTGLTSAAESVSVGALSNVIAATALAVTSTALVIECVAAIQGGASTAADPCDTGRDGEEERITLFRGLTASRPNRISNSSFRLDAGGCPVAC